MTTHARTDSPTRNFPRDFLFLMDPAETLNLATETSLLLMQELINRGHRVFWLQIENLTLQDDQPMGLVSQVIDTEPLNLLQAAWSNLNRFDAVLVRKDPPVDTRYLQMCLILDHLDPDIAQFNDVKALRNFNEKMLPLRWPEFTPPGLISMNAEQIERFLIEHQSMILKPLNDCSGRGISKITLNDSNDEGGTYRDKIQKALADSDGKPRFLVAQKYLPGVHQGDKRVFLVNGEPLGMVNRIPRSGSHLANIHQGAQCVPAQLTGRENRIIKAIAPFLREQGIFLAGADFIDGYLTELNITSPSAVRQINEVSGQQLQVRIVDAMLEKVAHKPCCYPFGARSDSGYKKMRAL